MVSKSMIIAFNRLLIHLTEMNQTHSNDWEQWCVWSHPLASLAQFATILERHGTRWNIRHPTKKTIGLEPWWRLPWQLDCCQFRWPNTKVIWTQCQPQSVDRLKMSQACDTTMYRFCLWSANLVRVNKGRKLIMSNTGQWSVGLDGVLKNTPL